MSEIIQDSTIQELRKIFQDNVKVQSGLQDSGNEAYLVSVPTGIVNGYVLEELDKKFYKVVWIASSSFERYTVNVKVAKLPTDYCERCEKEVLETDLIHSQTTDRDVGTIPYDFCKECKKELDHETEVDYLNEQLADLDPRNDDYPEYEEDTHEDSDRMIENDDLPDDGYDPE